MSWPSVSDGKKCWAVCLLAVRLSSSRSARPSLCFPSPAKTSGLQNECLEELATHSICQGERQTRAGEGAWMAFIRSGRPRARPSCLEKPRAAPCEKWLFGSAAELLNVLDRLGLPQSLATRTKQLFRAGRHLGHTGRTISRTAAGTNTPEPSDCPGCWGAGRGTPGLRTSSAALVALVLTPSTLYPPLTHSDPGASALLLFPVFLSSWFPPSLLLALFPLSHDKGALPLLPDRPTGEGLSILALTPWSVPASRLLHSLVFGLTLV